MRNRLTQSLTTLYPLNLHLPRTVQLTQRMPSSLCTPLTPERLPPHHFSSRDMRVVSLLYILCFISILLTCMHSYCNLRPSEARIRSSSVPRSYLTHIRFPVRLARILQLIHGLPPPIFFLSIFFSCTSLFCACCCSLYTSSFVFYSHIAFHITIPPITHPHNLSKSSDTLVNVYILSPRQCVENPKTKKIIEELSTLYKQTEGQNSCESNLIHAGDQYALPWNGRPCGKSCLKSSG